MTPEQRAEGLDLIAAANSTPGWGRTLNRWLRAHATELLYEYAAGYEEGWRDGYVAQMELELDEAQGDAP